MPWEIILPLVVSFIQNFAKSAALPTAPPPEPYLAPLVPVPSAAIKDLQTMLNIVLQLNPPLDEDGWIGPLTEAAIEQAIAKLHSLGIG